MYQQVKLSDLQYMTQESRTRVLSSLIETATSNGAVSSNLLSARIKRFELQYEMSSDEMKEELGKGSLKETAEISQWLFLIGLRNGHVQQ